MRQKRTNSAKIVCAVNIFLFINVIPAPAANAVELTAADRAAVVEKLAAAIEDGYVLEAKGRDLARQLRLMAADKRFTEDDPKEFADVLQRTLREISGDVHFRVAFGSMADSIRVSRAVGRSLVCRRT